MARRRRHVPLSVRLNGRLVGQLAKASSGAISFKYDESWLQRENAFPISLSLPLREDDYRGDAVSAVFDNLLPDSEGLRRQVAERVGAESADGYSLLAAIGRDCVGALQFLPEGEDPASSPDASPAGINGESLDDGAIEALLKTLGQAPLGLSRDDHFRISVAGAQEKTALLFHDGRWLKPRATTPTTHIFKTPIGRLPNGIDLSNSVENEYYCLRLMKAFGLPAAEAEVRMFGEAKALVVERFDRRWTRTGRLLRLPQEDFCQALSIPPSRKYQSDGGPSFVDCLRLLAGSDRPATDQQTILKAQLLFWLIGATDGHAKNFSIFLAPGGAYRLTPLYDVLTAQPSLDTGEIEPNLFRLAMSVGKSRHFRMHEILGRHFRQSGETAGLPARLVGRAIDEIAQSADAALDLVANALPADFPGQIHESVSGGVKARLARLAGE